MSESFTSLNNSCVVGKSKMNKRVKKHLLLRVVLLLLGNGFGIALMGQTQKVQNDFDLIENLNNQWLVYDDAYQSYVPYLPDRYPVQYTLNLILNPAQYHSYRLLLQSNQLYYLFIEAKLVKVVRPNEKVSLDLDSIQRFSKNQTILFSLYNPEGHTNMPKAQVIFPRHLNTRVSAVAEERLQAKLRGKSAFLDFLIITSVFVLGLYAFLWNHHQKVFSQCFNWRLMIPGSLREDVPLINRPLSGSSLLFLLAHSLLLSLFYITIQQSSEHLFANVLMVDLSNQFWPIAKYFLLMAGFIFLLLLGKYTLIQTVGSVFRLSGVTYAHYYEYLLFSRVFYTVVVFIQLILFLTTPVWVAVMAEVIIWIVLLFNIVRIIIINSVLSKLTSTKNLYLFSYLCTTEVIPLLIGIKILIK